MDGGFAIVTQKEYPSSYECYNAIKICPETIKIIKKLNYSICDKVYLLETKSISCKLCLEYLIQRSNYSNLDEYYSMQIKSCDSP